MNKFGKLAAKVGSRRLAGYITTHNPKVAARAKATRARHATLTHMARKPKAHRTSTSGKRRGK